MARGRVILIRALLFMSLTECLHGLPQVNRTEQRQERQDEDDDEPTNTVSPLMFGQSVAQIITGALTGNIDAIIKGSFGFIGDPHANRISHNTWEALKGNPTKPPPRPDSAEESNTMRIVPTTTVRPTTPPPTSSPAPPVQTLSQAPSAAPVQLVPPSEPSVTAQTAAPSPQLSVHVHEAAPSAQFMVPSQAVPLETIQSFPPKPVAPVQSAAPSPSPELDAPVQVVPATQPFAPVQVIVPATQPEAPQLLSQEPVSSAAVETTVPVKPEPAVEIQTAPPAPPPSQSPPLPPVQTAPAGAVPSSPSNLETTSKPRPVSASTFPPEYPDYSPASEETPVSTRIQTRRPPYRTRRPPSRTRKPIFVETLPTTTTQNTDDYSIEFSENPRATAQPEGQVTLPPQIFFPSSSVVQQTPPSGPVIEGAFEPWKPGNSAAQVAPPEVYYPGSPYYPTSRPVRTTQPTYPTLAPLDVIEGRRTTEPEPEEIPSTTSAQDGDDEDTEGDVETTTEEDDAEDVKKRQLETKS